MKVTLTLEGKPRDVTALLSMALEQGVVTSFEVVDAQSTSATKGAGVRIAPQPFRVGDQVKVTAERSNYGVPLGTVGTVVAIKGGGKGYTVTVDWNSSDKTLPKRVGASTLGRA